MKCLQCGSVLHSERIERNEYQSYWMYRCENVECKNHNPFSTNELNKQQAYQTRLSNVLSKFEKKGEDFYRFEPLYKGNYFYCIQYSEKCFEFLTTDCDYENIFMPISLETVESLLNDLEEAE